MAYDKSEVREALTVENIFEILQELGADPEYTSFGILASTICHNHPGEGSHKLYYYLNTGLFQCYTGCGSFDVFELIIKAKKIQENRDMDLNSAVVFIAVKFGITSVSGSQEIETEDWRIFENYLRIQDLEIKDYNVVLKEYDQEVLDHFNYKVRIVPWIKDNISFETMQKNHIGFFPGTSQITIPHYDINNRFIGLRGRTLIQEDAERFGKYRPMKINGVLYNHPLSMNLYNLNNSKENIGRIGKAIIFESEKSCLQYQSMFGSENDITVACCGSNISSYQINWLCEVGAKEIIIGFDRQFQEIGDVEFKQHVAKLKKIYNKYKTLSLISFLFDKKLITGYKSSPTDEGKDKFLQLYKERIIL